MKKKKILFWVLLTFVLILTACSKSKPQTANSLPTAKTVLTTAQKTKINNFHSVWTQTNDNSKVLQKAEVKYSKKPFVIFANFTTNSNHYKMWLNHKNNYIQMQGTSTKKWFKTKLSKSAPYQQLSDALVLNSLQAFNQVKDFKVKKNSQGYLLTYQGKNKQLWQDLIASSLITSIIGIDQNNAKAGLAKVNLQTDRHYHLTGLQLTYGYQENKTKKQIQVVIDQVNKLSKLSIPIQITKSAVDLGASSH